MRFRWLAAIVATVLTCGLVSAQPKDVKDAKDTKDTKNAKDAGPTIELRLRSVNDLVDKFEYLAGLVGKEDAATQVRELIKALSADGKGIEGIDPKKPIGAYATLVKEVETSPLIVMLPIADEAQFLKALNTRFGITPEKNDDGTQKAALPVVNEVNLRFANGYLYLSQKAKDLDPKTIIKPETYFGKDDNSAASLLVHIDRIPEELKTFALGQFELSINEERKKNDEKETDAEKRLKNFLLDNVIGGTKALAEDGKDLSVKLLVDPKTDALSAEVTLTAKSGSAMAKNFTALGDQTSLPVGIVASAEKPIARGNVKLAVTEGMKKDYAAAIDSLLADLVKKAKPQEEPFVKQFVEAVGPTLKAGQLDAAAALTGPDAKDHYQLLTALAVADGKKIEKFAKDISEHVGEVGEFKFDIEKIGDFSLHRIDLKKTDEKFEKIFGTKSIWLAVSDKHIAVSIEPDGETIKKALKAKAAPASIVLGEASGAKLLPLANPNLKPDELKALLKDSFGDGPIGDKDRTTLSVTGGKQLTVKFDLRGKLIRLGAGLDGLKGK